MQATVDTHGYLIRGLRRACGEIKESVRRRECYFVYYNKKTCEVLVNIPSNNRPELVLIMECGTFELTQQEIADFIVDKLNVIT